MYWSGNGKLYAHDIILSQNRCHHCMKQYILKTSEGLLVKYQRVLLFTSHPTRWNRAELQHRSKANMQSTAGDPCGQLWFGRFHSFNSEDLIPNHNVQQVSEISCFQLKPKNQQMPLLMKFKILESSLKNQAEP